MKLPPGPSSHKLLHTLRWLRSPYEFLAECAAAYGDIFQITIAGYATMVIVSSPELIKEVFAWDPAQLQGGRSNEVVRPFVGPNSVLVLDGAEHQRQRKLLMPAFHGERMQAYGRTMLDLAEAAVASWPTGRPFKLHAAFQDITLRVIVRTIFGAQEGANTERLIEASRDVIDFASNPLLLFPVMQRDLGALSPWGKFLRKSAVVDDLLRQEIDRRRAAAESEGADVLAMLIAARDEAGEPMTFAEIRDELATMLVAGHETTATALAWTLCYLLRDEPLWRRLQEELAQAVEGGRLVPERVARLELLDATVREGLRIRPVAPLVGRRVATPVQLGGYDIPAGFVVAPGVYLAHHRAAAFAEPERFDPDRFLRGRPSPTEWLPFGGGVRRCLGAAFATYEMKMVLAAMLRGSKLALTRGYAPRAQRRGVTLAPAGGVPVIRA